MPLADDAQKFLDEIARRTHGFLGADLMELCRDAGLKVGDKFTATIEPEPLAGTEDDFVRQAEQRRPELVAREWRRLSCLNT